MKAKPRKTTKINRVKTGSAGFDDPGQERALEALRESEAKFSAAFHSTPTALVLARLSDSKFEYVNESFLKLVGYEREEIIGKTPGELNIFPNPADLAKIREILIETKQVRNVDTTVRSKNGEIRYVLFSVDIIELNQQPYSLTTMLDITERIRAEKQVIQMKRLYATLSQVNQTIVRIRDHNELYQSICDVAVKFGGFAMAWIGLLDEVTGEVKPVAANGLDVNQWPFPIVNIQEGILKDSLSATAIRTSRVMTSEDILADDRLQNLHDLFQKHAYHSAATIPFRLRGKTIGMLSLASSDSGLFKAEEEMLLLEEMGLDISFALDTTETEMERRQVEEALKESEQQYRGLFETSPVAISHVEVVCDAEGQPNDYRFLYVNPAYERFVHMQAADLVGHTVFEAMPLADRAIVERLGWVALTGVLDHFEGHTVRLNADWEITAFSPRHGQCVTYIVDITERKRAEEKIGRQNQRLKILREIDVAILAADSVENIVGAALSHTRELIDCRRASLTLFDWDKQEALLFDVKTAGETSNPKEMRAPLAPYQEMIQIFLKNEPLVINDLHMVTDPPPALQKTIQAGFRSLCSLPLFSQSSLIGTFGMASETPGFFDEERISLAREVANQVAIAITQKRLIEGLRESEEKYHAFFQNSLDAILLTMPDGTIQAANPAACKMFGRTEAEICAVGRSGLVDTNDPRLVTLLEERAKTGKAFGELTMLRHDGTPFPVEMSSALFQDRQGNTRTSMIIRDITERQQAVRDLRESEQKFSLLFKKAPFAISLSRLPDRAIVEVNDEFEKLVGYPRGEVLGKTSLDINMYPDPATRARMGAEFQARGFTRNAELEFRTKFGDLRHILINTDFVEIDGEKHLLTTAQDVTERKQAEDKLAYQGKLIESMNDAIVATDAEYHITAWNKSAEDIFGWTADEMLGKKSTEILHTEFPSGNAAEFRQSIADTGRWRGEITQRRKDGTKVPIEVSSMMLRDTQGQLLGLISVNRDITDRKLAEEQLHYQAYLLENVNDAIVASDAQFRLKVWNLAAEEMYGWKAEEVLGRSGVEILQTRFSEADAEEMRRQIAAVGYYVGEATQLRKDGTRIPVEVASIVLRDDGGKITDYLSVNRDITERKRAEEALRVQNERFQRFVESNIVGIVIADATGKIITANDYYLNILGVTRKDFEDGNVDWRKFTPSEWLAADEQAIRELRERGVCEPYEKEYARTNGTRVPVYIVNAMLPGPDEQIAAFVLDISQRQQAEDKIRLQNLRLKALREIDTAILSADSVQDIVGAALNHTRELIGCRRAALTLFDWATNEAEIFDVRDDRETFQQKGMRLPLAQFAEMGETLSKNKPVLIDELAELQSPPAPFQVLLKTGIHSVCILPLYSQGELMGTFGMFSEAPAFFHEEKISLGHEVANQVAIAISQHNLIEDLRILNARLEQRVVERTEELNQLNIELTHANRAKTEFLANMSHELRTPLNSILGLSETLLEKIRGPLNERQEQALQVIASSGQHLLSLINDVLEVAKIEAGKLDIHPDIIDVQELCHSSLNFVKETALKKSIALEFHADPSISTLFADLQRTKQILVNLLSNAVKFTPEHGKITFDVSTNSERDQIRFAITDNGIGIAAENLNKLFSPFVQLDSSLARQNEGTGLGLTIVYKLAELHGGSVNVESTPGKGSRFTVILPWNQTLTTEENVSAAPARMEEPAKAGRESEPGSAIRTKILIAEDNETNQIMLNDYLQDQGFAVSLANNGIEALSQAEAIQPDLILMDIQMPEMHGLEAIQRLRADPRFAATPIIALTALAMPGDRERCLDAGANEYFSKPVSLKGLVKTITNLLQSAKK